MFNLIATIMSLLLMIAAAVGGLYYFGNAADDAELRARLAQYYNYSAQIDSALLLYNVEQGGVPAGDGVAQVQELASGGYLSEPPTGGWFLRNVSSAPATGSLPATASNVSYRPLESVAVCRQLNRVNGSDVTSSGIVALQGCPPCESAQYLGYPACIDNASVVAGSP